MTSLTAAAAFFLLIHLLVSGTRLRDALVRKIGEGAYMGVFSLSSVAGLAWLILAFGRARSGAEQEVFWAVTPASLYVQMALTFVAFLFIVVGITTPNPTSVRQEKAIEKPDAVRGMLRVTRHPFLWGVAIWALGHLLVNGDTASFLLFGSLLILALFGTASIDAKRRRALGESWEGFAAQTSSIPFAAIAAGRQTLKVGEIGWWRIVLAVTLWAAMAWGHPYLFGVRALP